MIHFRPFQDASMLALCEEYACLHATCVMELAGRVVAFIERQGQGQLCHKVEREDA